MVKTVVTSARSGLVETTITGSITVETVECMVTGYRANPSETWLIRGETATGYTTGAVPAAKRLFAAARTVGLRRVIAVLPHPIMRMGAAAVSLGLRTIGSPVEIRVVDDLKSALDLASEPLRE